VYTLNHKIGLGAVVTFFIVLPTNVELKEIWICSKWYCYETRSSEKNS